MASSQRCPSHLSLAVCARVCCVILAMLLGLSGQPYFFICKMGVELGHP